MRPKAKRAPKAEARTRCTASATRGIRVLAADDTGVREALREPSKARVAVHFAVQLLWSVQPIDPAGVPALEIFGAYTLYTTETNRAAPKWYALRLGFFSNAISAKQVALYLRSQFSTVAVIPISETERSRALGQASPDASIALRGDDVRSPSIDVHRTPEFRRLLARLWQRLRDQSNTGSM